VGGVGVLFLHAAVRPHRWWSAGSYRATLAKGAGRPGKDDDRGVLLGHR
jgi:hypothetical protein